MEEKKELVRQEWKKNPIKFSVEDYTKGMPTPSENGWFLKPWKGDLGTFAHIAAEQILVSNTYPFPLDVLGYALSLRRIMALESLKLPVDPVSVNLIRVIESFFPNIETVHDIIRHVQIFMKNLEKMEIAPPEEIKMLCSASKLDPEAAFSRMYDAFFPKN